MGKKITIPDSVIPGFFSGIISIVLLYILIFTLNWCCSTFYGLNDFFFYPKPQLIILAIGIVLFRIMIVNLKKVEFAKGFFMSLFLAVLVCLLNQKIHII